MLAPFFQGFGTCGGLIMAIGAQNAFLLSQSVRKNHHLTIALMCIVSDMLLIGLGVFSIGQIVASSPDVRLFATFFWRCIFTLVRIPRFQICLQTRDTDNIFRCYTLFAKCCANNTGCYLFKPAHLFGHSCSYGFTRRTIYR
ncbi:Arginine exporter protein ArgO [Halodesulfovibrio sp. MK-HDV]|nr:Arginine exporter protein ArgO [Halodesulfovibrio sp. MK-HDV]